ncbi:MAG: chemotaxis protein CheX [Nitrospira sp.]|nr:chemotaxis protein CheX [Nitrospira sp.]
MTEPIRDKIDIARLDTIAKIGADKIAGALSKWTGLRIKVDRSNASIVHYSKLLEPSFSPEDIVTAILIRTSGSMNGYLIFLFDERSALTIVKKILHKEMDSVLTLDDISRSVLEETGNITGTAFLNTIAAYFNLEIYPSSPVTASDLCGAILESVIAQFAIKGETALTCQISLSSDDEEIKGIFAMLPDDLNAWKTI